MLARVVTVAIVTALAGGTVAAFVLFDRGSHSASDTLRPFVLTVGPAWVLGLAGARALARRSALEP